MSLKKDFDLWDVVLVLIALIPIYIGNGFSINYFFILIPLISRNVRLRISKNIILYLACFFLIYLVSFIYVSIFLTDIIDRSFISFVLFMSPFIWGAFEIKNKFYNALLFGVFIFSFSFAIWQIFTVFKYLFLFDLTDFYSLKKIVGSNRVSFILICAYFISSNLVKGSVLYITRVTIILGILLTFSRAALITFIITVLFELLLKNKLLKFETLFKLTISPIIFGFFLYYLLPGGDEIISFFNERLLEKFMDSGYSSISSNSTSEGIRIDTWTKMIEYLKDHFLFFTGTGFLGPWILTNIQVASSHNQFLDVFFRSGILGVLLVYIPLTFFLLSKKYLLESKIFLFVLLFYGLFHESFKETQGAFLLGIILSQIFNPISKINYKHVENLH